MLFSTSNIYLILTLKRQINRKLLRIHVKFYCNGNKKYSPRLNREKGYYTSITVLERQYNCPTSSHVSDFGNTTERSTLGHWTSLISSTGTFAADLREVLFLRSAPVCLRCFTTGWAVWLFMLFRALARVVYMVDLPDPGHPRRITLRLVCRVVWSWRI